MKKLKFLSGSFHFTRTRLVKAIVLGLSVGMLGLVISPLQFAMNFEENVGLGLLFKLRGERQPPDNIVVVSIDKQSSDVLDLHNNPDKWPRSLHARLTRKLAQEGAAAIVFDVHFIEPRHKEDDNLFARAINKSQRVILCEPLIPRELPASGSGEAVAGFHNIVKIVKPIDLFAEAAIATAPFTLPRIPFKVNRYWTFQAGAGNSPTVPVLAFQFANLELYDDLIRLLQEEVPAMAGKLPADAKALKNDNLRRTARNIREIFEGNPLLEQELLASLAHSNPSPAGNNEYRKLAALVRMYGGPASRYINYYGPPRTITTIPYYQALKEVNSGRDENVMDFTDKVVFVGLSEVLLADRKDSFYTVFSRSDGIFVSGVEIMASVYANIMNNDSVQPVGFKTFALLVLCWGMLLGIVCLLFDLKTGGAGVIILSIGYLFSASFLFTSQNIWLPVMMPLFFQAPVAFLGGVGIEHSRLFKETLQKLRMEKDLSVARDIQMSMLPSSCPEIKGYEIAASSTPAREVSGDFFDFIDIDESRIGFVIADVTGKSVSGALVMTASKSVFRLFSEEYISVGEIMVRANKQIKKDITRAKGMFVALLYAVLNIDNKTLRLCSAGQTQPILLSAATGKTQLIDTEGDAFPLGIIDEPDYRETILTLEEGDTVVFYTDGVVEAQNKKGGMYGFERFDRVIRDNRGQAAEEFLKNLIDDINGFVGKAEQHDDLTIVVIKVADQE